MKTNYVIELDSQDKEEVYEKADNNILEVTVQPPVKLPLEGRDIEYI